MMTTDPIKLTARRFEEMKAHKLHREAEFQIGRAHV